LATSFLNVALDRLARSVFLPGYRQLSGDHTYRYVREVERLHAADRATILAHQLGRLRHICTIAMRESAFYAQRFHAAGITDPSRLTFGDFTRIPCLTREDLRTAGERIRNRRFSPHQLRQSATGGTTSAPVPIYMDWECYYRRRAATIAFDRWYGYEPGQRIALLWGAHQDLPDMLRWKARLRNRLLERSLFLPASPMDDSIMERYYHELRAFNPRLLQAYPSALTVFADFLLRMGHRLPLEAIVCTAEPLLPQQADLIESAFGRRPYAWYGSRECGRVATERPGHTGLYVNRYGLYLELVRDLPSQDPDLGSIVITDLWNAGFPLIRYNTDDVGKRMADSEDDSPSPARLLEICGRVADNFVNSRGQVVPGIAFHRILKDHRQVKEVQIVQRGIRDFEIRIVPGVAFSGSTESLLRDTLAGFMQEENEVRFVLVDTIAPEPSGKRRLCVNRLPP
jgi:phenylacetate-CoA ligase